MPSSPRLAGASVVFCIALIAGGCASTGSASLAPGTQAGITGPIAAIDTRPWTYDGNAVVQVDSDGHGRVAVQLPARWNLCKAAPVDVQALSVGMRVQAIGTVGSEGEIVVCQEEAHRLVPAK